MATTANLSSETLSHIFPQRSIELLHEQRPSMSAGRRISDVLAEVGLTERDIDEAVDAGIAEIHELEALGFLEVAPIDLAEKRRAVLANAIRGAVGRMWMAAHPEACAE